MWLFLNDCFLSIVHKDCARDEVLVRARRKGDIEKLFPKAKVDRVTHADYLFRSVISRREFEKAIVEETRRITYSNFKDSVPKEEQALHDAYLRVWGTMSTLQPTRPYTGQPTFSFDPPQKPTYRHPNAAGGFALAAKMTPAERSAAASHASRARWGKLNGKVI
jgi:hypothetical protein